MLSEVSQLVSICGQNLKICDSIPVQARLCIFVQFYAEHLFPNNDTELVSWVMHAIECVFQSSVILSLHACETIIYIFQEPIVYSRLDGVYFLSLLVPKIPHIESTQVFDMLDQTFKAFSSSIESFLTEIV